MSDSQSVPRPPRAALRRFSYPLAWSSAGLVGGLGLVAFASWAFTPNLEDSNGSNSFATTLPPNPSSSTPTNDSTPAAVPLVWPETIQQGDHAKRLLLAILEEVERRLQSYPGHRAQFKRLERIHGQLGPWQTIELKVLHNPLSVYMKFLEPDDGKEVLYSQGRFDNHLIAHPGGMARLLTPRLKLDPNGPLAMAENRHPITSAGLLNLVRRLIHFRRLDLNHPTSHLRLDHIETPDGQMVFRSCHRHLKRTDQHPYSRSEIWYDSATCLPIRVENHDWPAGIILGRTISSPADLGDPFAIFDAPDNGETLVEIYEYAYLDFETPLTPLDFDPANPAYGFRRF